MAGRGGHSVHGGLNCVSDRRRLEYVGERVAQQTDDAYTRADLTPLSTKVAGLVSGVTVSDYQPMKSGDLLVQLRDDDFQAQAQQAEAAVASREYAPINNQR
jgi:membrane fusion protein (multidrug efflux system)